MRNLITIISLLGLLSCGDNDDIAFINYDQSRLNHTIYAYETELKGGFSFTTSDNWFVEIEDKTQTSKSEGNDSWVNVSPMSGSAGDINLAINMEVNNTGKNRNVEINIYSDDSIITITIDQKNYFKSIASVRVDFIEGGNEESVSSSEDIVFGYDNELRLIRVELTPNKPITIEYHSDMIIETSDSHSLPTGIEVKNILNTEGIVVSGNKLRTEVHNGITHTFPKEYALTYNSDGYLTNKEITAYDHDQPINTTFVWSGNNLTKRTTIESFRGSDDHNTNNILFSYADCKNMVNLDLNVIITDSYHSLLDFSTLIRKTGKSSNNLVSKVVDRYDFASKFWNESTYRFEYELDDDGYVVKVKRFFYFRYSAESENRVPKELLDAIYIITYNE